MHLETNIRDPLTNLLIERVDHFRISPDYKVVVNVRGGFTLVVFVNDLAAGIIGEKVSRITHCPHNVTRKTLTQMKGPVPTHRENCQTRC